MIIFEEASEIPEKVWEETDVSEFKARIEGTFKPELVDKLAEEQDEYVDPYDNPAHDPDMDIEAEKAGIAESNERQSEFMHKHQDEPNAYQGEDEDDHVCDELGPQDWDGESGIYRLTCSICGNMSLENI
jgi:hypothetical protein